MIAMIIIRWTGEGEEEVKRKMLNEEEEVAGAAVPWTERVSACSPSRTPGAALQRPSQSSIVSPLSFMPSPPPPPPPPLDSSLFRLRFH